MEVDLCGKNISELCFSDATTTRQEAKVARRVTSLLAERNCIQQVVGLGNVFQHLKELRLKHNQLGSSTTAPYITMDAARRHLESTNPNVHLCDGIPGWIAALPPTLEVLDISYNHLNSFVCCTCKPGANSSVPTDAPTPSTELMVRRLLRHAFPLAMAVSFPCDMFPNLKHLDVSHNALTATVRDTDAQEKTWSELVTTLRDQLQGEWVRCMIEHLNVDFNAGLNSVNGVLIGGSGIMDGVRSLRLQSMSLVECGVDDLLGVAGVAYASPSVRNLRLHPCPLTKAILQAQHSVMSEFVEALMISRTWSATKDSNNSCSNARQSEARSFASSHCAELNDILVGLIPHEQPLPWQQHPGGQLSTLAQCVYASLIQAVVPTLTSLDGIEPIQPFRTHLDAAIKQVLASENAAARVHATVTTSKGDWTTLAAAATPSVRSKVKILDEIDTNDEANLSSQSLHKKMCVPEKDESRYLDALQALQQQVGDGASAARSSQAYLPDGFSREHQTLYEQLSRRAKEMEEEIAQSQERCRGLRGGVESLTQQLTVQRRTIADQRRTVMGLREERDALQQRILDAKKRIQKRKKEVMYGTNAIKSRQDAARERTAMERLEAREKEVLRRERSLARRLAMAAPLSVDYGYTKPQHRKPRSEVLREAAAKDKIAKMADPFAYSPAKFKTSSHANAPFASTTVEDFTDAEFSALYEKHRGSSELVDQVARDYCSRISPEQQEQLRQALSLSPSRSPPAGASTCEKRLPSTEYQSSGTRPQMVAPTRSESRGSGERSQSTTMEGDFSAMSLSELFEAAAAIRRKQMALEQRQQQWMEHSPAEIGSRDESASHEEREDSPGVSPPTPAAAMGGPGVHGSHLSSVHCAQDGSTWMTYRSSVTEEVTNTHPADAPSIDTVVEAHKCSADPTHLDEYSVDETKQKSVVAEEHVNRALFTSS